MRLFQDIIYHQLLTYYTFTKAASKKKKLYSNLNISNQNNPKKKYYMKTRDFLVHLRVVFQIINLEELSKAIKDLDTLDKVKRLAYLECRFI